MATMNIKGDANMDYREWLKGQIYETGYRRDEFFKMEDQKILEYTEDYELSDKQVLDYMIQNNIYLNTTAAEAKKFVAEKMGIEKTKIVHEKVVPVQVSPMLDALETADLRFILQLAREEMGSGAGKKSSAGGSKKVYEVKSVLDKNGSTDKNALTELINSYAKGGWDITAVYSKEPPKSAGNSAAGEVVVIFEKDGE